MKKSISFLLAGLAMPVSMMSVAQTDLTSIINTSPMKLQTISQEVAFAGQVKWPFMAAIYHKYRQYDDANDGKACAATFLGGRYLMTSGRCGASLSDNLSDYAIVGVNNLDNVGSESQKIAIRHVYLPGNYQAVTPLSDGFAKPYVHDIAIIELEHEASGTAVKLASESLSDALRSGDILTVMGWRDASLQGFTYTKTLNQAELPYVDRSTCQNLGDNYGYVGDDALCAGDVSDVTDSCTGDFGSPLMVNHDGTFRQVGIASWGNECYRADPYGVYTNVTKYSGWIKARTSGVSYAQQNVSVNSNKRTLVKVAVTNYSDEVFSMSGFDLPEGVTVFDNRCEDALAQGDSCLVIVRVDREKAGLAPDTYDTAVKLAIHTTHSVVPEFPVVIHFTQSYSAKDTFDPGMNPSEFPGTPDDLKNLLKY